MKKEELEKYIGVRSPGSQEKARACKDVDKLKALQEETEVDSGPQQ